MVVGKVAEIYIKRTVVAPLVWPFLSSWDHLFPKGTSP